jgi:hypothetical protein
VARPRKPSNYLVTGLKLCPWCNKNLPLNCFTPGKHYHGGISSYCKICRAEKEQERRKTKPAQKSVKEYKVRNKIKTKNYELKRKFNISLEDYNNLLQNQKFSCAICNKQKSDKLNRLLAVDHCHITGKIRGLLCTNCNMGIGNFQDNLDLLKIAIKYLEKYK